ncbi:RidA family protein [Pelagibacterium montanilacus]|uniref:RidA family protein n=1 Tax=Pelagibacterium montanilacus TaxID=2185280 RepID=UPI000F8D7A0D|nr:RidA family protein [Pelagibacterium montanilacus]
MTIEQTLKDLGHELPKPAAPAASYAPVRQSGNLLYVSGQISIGPDGIVKGRLGDGTDVAAGQKCAEFCALQILGQVATVAPLEKIAAVLKLTVLVASHPDFNEQHVVANGASDLFIKVLGEKGKHARAAFGVAALPLGAAVEIDAVIELEA